MGVSSGGGGFVGGCDCGCRDILDRKGRFCIGQ